MRELTSFALDLVKVSLCEYEHRYFVTWSDFETRQGKSLEVLNPEHGFVVLRWCEARFEVAEA